jgi:hypothetical protein
MFVHSVYFWLDRSLDPARRAAFEQGVRSLGTIPTLRQFQVGRPAGGDRPVIDRTYDFALLTVFDDQAGHDAYQVHPTHLAFVRDHARDWIQVRVYDSV